MGTSLLLEEDFSGADPVPGLERLVLLGIDWYEVVHLLYYLFSVQFNIYNTYRILFTFEG